MKRITKYEPSKDSMFPYKLIDNELSTELDAIHQLGRFEDLMEEYNINSIEQLENILGSKFLVGGFRSGGKSIVGKGMLYNILSEELGCPLEVVFGALKQGYIYVYDSHYNFDDCTTTKANITFNNDKFYIGFARNTRRLQDYQKTWWLKGEKDD